MKTISRRYQDAVSRIPNLNVIISTIIVLVVLIAFFSSLSPYFFTTRNIFNVLNQVSIYLILGVGITLVMATGEIDISIGSMIGLTSVILGNLVIEQGFPWWLGIIACVLVSSLCGALNGFIVSKFNVPSIVVTLGTMTAFLGLAYAYAAGRYFYRFPPQILWIGRARPLGIPLPIYLAIIAFLIGSYFLTMTATGRYFTVTGANRHIANLSGIKISIIRFLPFLIMGVLVGISTIILAARIDAVQANTGAGVEIHVIAAVVLGGTSILGGKALMSGTLLGVLILGVLENGLVLIHIPYYIQQVIIGFLFIIVVAIHSWREKQIEQ